MAGKSRYGPRLDAVAGMVPPGSRVADIGTGHAGLPLRLWASGRASYCVATEASPATLREIRRRVGGRSWPASIELRGGDGLAALVPEDRIDVLVLSGIGARKIIRILDDRRLELLELRRIVLQPQSEPERLDCWLAGQGYRIVAETRARDRGRLYRVLAAERRMAEL